MKQQDLVDLAHAVWDVSAPEMYTFTIDELEAFANAVAAAEREACAEVCDTLADQDTVTNYYRVAALAIRARGDA